MSNHLPAILGGKPEFEKNLPINIPDFHRYRKEIIEEINLVLDSNMLSNVNIYVKKFEDKIADYLKINNAVAFNSCTTAMILAIKNLGLQGKEVILPSFSFVATAHMAYWNGMVLKYVDINASTWNMDDLLIEDLISKDTAAILAVHMYGNPAKIKELSKIAEENNIYLLFDAAHALGSQYNGKSIAENDAISSYSLSPTKILSAVEGGFITTENDKLADELRVSRNYGSYTDYSCKLPGFNARMSEMHAATGYILFNYIDEFITNRQHCVREYDKQLQDIPGINFQKLEDNCTSAHKDYSIVIDRDKFGLTRDELAITLKQENISTRFYYYPPIHVLDSYRKYYSYKLPITEKISSNLISLPINNYMEIETISKICNKISHIYDYNKEIKQKLGG